MHTNHLYYEDAYLTRFNARIVERIEIDGRFALALDRTAFYPTGGGQPCDTGTLNGVPVVEVRKKGELVWHVLDQPIDSEMVDGCIDWQRRRDHMQNHSGQHVLSQAFVVAASAQTVAWRLSESTVTIDLNRVGLSDEELAEAERIGNEVVQQNNAITARIVNEIELPKLALRKQPDVDGPLRIVEIAAFDRVACSGTHVSSTAQVGLIKVLRTERRGPETRIHFVCGQRAVADYRRKHQLVRGLATRFTCSEDEVTTAVQRLQDEAQANIRALRAAQAALVEAETERLWSQVERHPAPRLIHAAYPTWDEDQIKTLVLSLKRHPGCFIGVAGGRSALVFTARSEDCAIDAGLLLRTAMTQVGVRGGARPDYAQGSAPSWEAAERALELIKSLARREPKL